MKKPNNTVMNYIYISTYTIVLFFLLLNIKYIWSAVVAIISILSPFTIGFVIAFVLNLLVKVFENKVFTFINDKRVKEPMRIKRPLAIVSALVVLVAIFSLLIVFIIPQLVDSVSTLLDSIPGYIKSIEGFITPLMSRTDVLSPIWDKVVGAWQDILQIIGQILSASINGIVSTTVTATSGVIKIFVGFVFAIYMLLTKESLILQIKKILYAFIKKDKVDSIISVGNLINVTFSKFLAGQCIEAVIVGGLCFVGMVIMGMPYPLLIGTIIGVTNMLPVVGPFIGSIPAAFIIFMVNPTQAFWFIIFVIVLQQVESNLIYPRVVGTSIGLSALWVLLAITIGGSLGGAVGMLLGVPSMAVIYKLVSGIVNKRLEGREIQLKSTENIKEIQKEEKKTEI